jgi:hypothetical protein
MERRFEVLHGPLASRICADGGLFATAPAAGFPGRFPFSGPLDWRLLLPGACCTWLAGIPSSRFITGAYLVAIGVPFGISFIFMHIKNPSGRDCFDSGRKNREKFQKT